MACPQDGTDHDKLVDWAIWLEGYDQIPLVDGIT